MGCLTSFITVPLAAAGWLLVGAGVLLLAGGFRGKSGALCEWGAGAGLLGAVLGGHFMLGGALVVAGAAGWWKFRELPPPGGEGGSN